ncbi:uncharacterized protein LOC134539953 [Bacillus rossius redtenbacheri]|uniref:uncharacterized protein LOC134539953 n=1 Tax=Bacillus rossius redtenbacheri TaxID=93214 RepID=UPI002FDE8D10
MNEDASGKAADEPSREGACDEEDGRQYSLVVGGARPKAKQMVLCNGANASRLEDATKLNNNQLCNTSDKTAPSTVCSANNFNRVMNENGTDVLYNANFHETVGQSSLSRGNQKGSVSANSNGCGKFGGSFSKSDRLSSNHCYSDSDGEEGYSGDECCIYTYKGDQAADLPNSFFRLDGLSRDQDHRDVRNGQAVNGVEGNRNGSSSPEMDFLEMDFDPGPSCEQDSDEALDCEEGEDLGELIGRSGAQPPLLEPEPVPKSEEDSECGAAYSGAQGPPVLYRENSTSTSGSDSSDEPQPVQPPLSQSNALRFVHVDSHESWGHHNSGDLCSVSHGSDDNHGVLMVWNGMRGRVQFEASNIMNFSVFKLLNALDKEVDSTVDSGPGMSSAGSSSQRVMLWSIQEACTKQVTQIGTSACGATAVINVLLLLNIPFHLDKLKEAVGTRLRAEYAPLPEYLFSRSAAGVTHEDIIRGLEEASEGQLYARFFPFYPQRDVSLCRWLVNWMRKGAVPVATLNLQRARTAAGQVPDAWHHQMVFGAGPRTVYLANPLEWVGEEELARQLCSPSVLLVRCKDVLARWTDQTDLRPLAAHPDPRWNLMNVLGQVVNVIRSREHAVSEHISIPASYASGVTLAVRRDSPAFLELRCAPDLPLLERGEASGC